MTHVEGTGADEDQERGSVPDRAVFLAVFKDRP